MPADLLTFLTCSLAITEVIFNAEKAFLLLIWLQLLLHGGGLAQILERVFEKRCFSNRLNLFAIPDKRDKNF